MADITDPNEASPSALDDHTLGNGDSRGIKRQRPSTADDDDDDDDKPGRERRKIEIKFITDKSRRHITFSKRKAGIMKKVGCIPLARPSATSSLTSTGLRVVCLNRHSGASAGCVGDGPGLYLYDTQTSASGHQGRGQESDSGMRRLR